MLSSVSASSRRSSKSWCSLARFAVSSLRTCLGDVISKLLVMALSCQTPPMLTGMKGPGSFDSCALTSPKPDCQEPLAKRMVCHSFPSPVRLPTCKLPPTPAPPTAVKGPGSFDSCALTSPKPDCQEPLAKRMVCHSFPSPVRLTTCKSPPTPVQPKEVKGPGSFDSCALTSPKPDCQEPLVKRMVCHSFPSPVRLTTWVSSVTLSLKKKGSFETATVVTLSVLNRVCVVKLALRWYTTPCGKLAMSGVLFAEKTP